jgi:amino acid transporter
LRRIQGYGVFIKGNWDVATLIFNYGLIFVAGAIALGWKIIKKTKFQRASEIDLHSGLEHFEKLTEYYRNEREGKPVKLSDKIMAKIF